MIRLEQTLKRIEPIDERMVDQAKKRIDALSKPPESLGILEELSIQLSGITKELYPSIDKKAVVVMAADHGVWEEGITTNSQEATVFQTLSFPKGRTGVSAIAQVTDAKIVTVDIGVKVDIPIDTGVLIHKIKYGTDNMAKGPAMTREEAIRAIEVGIEVANQEIADGVNLLGVGEMGIGNTTASTALLSVLAHCDPLEVTGIGAGVGPYGIAYKAEVIRKAISLNQPDANDPIDVLSKVGGLEIAGMAGVVLAAAANRVPVVIDGFISTIAALIASKLEPSVKGYLVASHFSSEPGAAVAAEILGLKPMLQMDMRLGEGSGAALAFPILDAACSVMENMATLEESKQLIQK